MMYILCFCICLYQGAYKYHNMSNNNGTYIHIYDLFRGLQFNVIHDTTEDFYIYIAHGPT